MERIGKREINRLRGVQTIVPHFQISYMKSEDFFGGCFALGWEDVQQQLVQNCGGAVSGCLENCVQLSRMVRNFLLLNRVKYYLLEL